MDAVEYFKAKARMTKDCGIDCDDCPLSHVNNGIFGIGCTALQKLYTEKAVEIVEKWAKEHPAKTRQSEFLKMFPNAELDNSFVLNICPKHIDTTHYFPCGKLCNGCRKEFWLAEVKEVE